MTSSHWLKLRAIQFNKLQGDAELSALLPNGSGVDSTIEEILAKKAENRAITPEEFTSAESICGPCGAPHDPDQGRCCACRGRKNCQRPRRSAQLRHLGMPLDQAGLKEHVFNILVEAGFETVGDLMMAMKMDAKQGAWLAGYRPEGHAEYRRGAGCAQLPRTASREPVAEAVWPRMSS